MRLVIECGNIQAQVHGNGFVLDIPEDSPYRREVEEAAQEANANFARLLAEHPWLRSAGRTAAAAVSRADKAEGYRRLLQLADRVTQAAAPHVACHKGCAQCCRISVVTTEWEARHIGKAIGRAPARVRKSRQREELVQQYFGVACPFLAAETCSIYEHRPLSCRIHVNLAATSFFCNTAIRPEWSFVPSLDLKQMLLAYGWLFRNETAADLRDFFPSGRA